MPQMYMQVLADTLQQSRASLRGFEPGLNQSVPGVPFAYDWHLPFLAEILMIIRRCSNIKYTALESLLLICFAPGFYSFDMSLGLG